MKSCICMSIVYTQVYSICGKNCICMSMMYIQFVVVTRTAIKLSCTLGNTFANANINGFWSPDRYCCLQIEERLVGVICGTYHVYPWMHTSIKIILQLHQVAVYLYKHENHVELWTTRRTASPLISFCHSRWRLLDARDC